MNNNMQYWIYAPGEKGMYWEEFHSQNIMAIGWDELGQLEKYKSKEAIAQKLRKLDSTDSSKKNNSTACWDFCHNIKIGDLIYVKRGRREFIGYGIVKSDYYYDDNREYFKHCRKIEWIKKGNWEADHNIIIKTLTDITPYPEL